MNGLRWRIDDEGSAREPASQDARWAQPGTDGEPPAGHRPGTELVDGVPVEPSGKSSLAAPTRPRLWRRRIRLALLGTVAVAAVLLAARVGRNARLLARIETEVSHAVEAEWEALSAGDEAVWSALQVQRRDAAARRRFRAGPVGPLPGLAPASDLLASIDVQAAVDTGHEQRGQVESATVLSTSAMEFDAVDTRSEEGMAAGLFVERSTWRRSRSGGWRRAPLDGAHFSSWPDVLPKAEDLSVAADSAIGDLSTDSSAPEGPLGLPSDLAEQLSRLRDRASRPHDGRLPRLRTPHLELVFLPVDAAHAADLAARLEPFLARRCALLGGLDTLDCRPVDLSLTLDTPGAAYVVPGSDLRLSSPSAGWAPADEVARAAYARSVLQLIVRGNPRTPRALESALVAPLLESLGAAEPSVATVGRVEGQRPDLWAMWRHLRPSVDALGDTPGLSPRQRAAAAAEGVTQARTMEMARYLHERGGYADTEALVRGLDEVGNRWLMDWLRPALGEDALPTALGWSAAAPRWPGPPSLLRCDDDADPLLLHPERSVPLDLRTTVCPHGALAVDAAISPAGSALAVACRGERRGSRLAEIYVLPLDGQGAAEPKRAASVAADTPFDCCLHWLGEGTLAWNAAGVTRGLRQIRWRGVSVAEGSVAGELAEWAPDDLDWLLPPFAGLSPTGEWMLLQGGREGVDWLALYAAPAMPLSSSPPVSQAPREPLWQGDGDQPRWSADGRQLAWLASENDAAERDVEGIARRVRVVDPASGVVSAEIDLAELVATATGNPDADERFRGLARLAGWSRDGRLGIALHSGVPEGGGRPVPDELWLLTWDPTGQRGLESRVERGVAMPALTDSWSATMAPGPLPASLGSAAPPELYDALWRWPLGRVRLEERTVHLGTRRSIMIEGASAPQPLDLDLREAWRFGRDGAWHSVPPNSLGVGPAGQWLLDPAGLQLVEGVDGEVLWRLPGISCLPDVVEERGAGAAR